MRLAAALVVLCAALFALSLVTGLAAAPAGQSLKALAIDDGTPLSLVMREIRLPRALLAVMVGASLGLSGAALQGYLRNPLAEPGLIGISGAAALGAVLAIQTGLVLTHPLALPLSALGMALGGAGVPAVWRNEDQLVHGYLRARHMSRRAAESFAAISAYVRQAGEAAAA